MQLRKQIIVSQIRFVVCHQNFDVSKIINEKGCVQAGEEWIERNMLHISTMGLSITFWQVKQPQLNVRSCLSHLHLRKSPNICTEHLILCDLKKINRYWRELVSNMRYSCRKGRLKRPRCQLTNGCHFTDAINIHHKMEWAYKLLKELKLLKSSRLGQPTNKIYSTNV